MKKYELTEETMDYGRVKLYRIRALRDFWNVKKGDLGGWIEKEGNLSHDGNAWVISGAWVMGNGRVRGNDVVCGNSETERKKWMDHEWIEGRINRDILAIQILINDFEAMMKHPQYGVELSKNHMEIQAMGRDLLILSKTLQDIQRTERQKKEC